MTPQEYDKEMRRLKGAVTRAKNKAKQPMSLADKLLRLRDVVDAEKALHNHKLNFHTLVT